MKTRFVLTWKKNEDGTKKGKARLVVLGFQDPHLGTEQTSAPTLTKRSKQLLLQVVVQNDWKLKRVITPLPFFKADLCKNANMP